MQLPLNNGKTIEGLTFVGSSVAYLDEKTSAKEVNITYFDYIKVGLLLLLLYLTQEFLDIRWTYLEELQSIDYYKKWSGFILGVFMILQWSLTWVRIVKKWNKAVDSFVKIHQWMGAISPVFFYAHAMTFGYAYLFFLSTVFLSNMVVGYLNPKKVKVNVSWYIQGWMILHVSASVLLTLLMFYHGFMAFYFK